MAGRLRRTALGWAGRFRRTALRMHLPPGRAQGQSGQRQRGEFASRKEQSHEPPPRPCRSSL